MLRSWTHVDLSFVAFVNNIHLEIDRGNCNLLILLDLLTAFDTVNHEVLHLYHLWIFMKPSLIILNYLIGRSHRMVMSAGLSSPWDLSCMVPWFPSCCFSCSTLYPRHWVRKCRFWSEVPSHQYTDHTECSLSFSSNLCPAVSVLTCCLANSGIGYR